MNTSTPTVNLAALLTAGAGILILFLSAPDLFPPVPVGTICVRAERLLKRKGVDYERVAIWRFLPGGRRTLTERFGAQHATVPQISGTPVGGWRRAGRARAQRSARRAARLLTSSSGHAIGR